MSDTLPAERFFQVEEVHAGVRLDQFLSGQIPDMSRSRIKNLITSGHASLSGHTIIDPNTRVKPGDVYALEIPVAVPAKPRPESMALDIVHEDDDLIVIDKPAGLVVHPGAGNWSGTLVNALLAHCGESLSGIGGVRRPGIVHRLDKDTSGLLVVAKTDAAHQGLAAQFADHGREGPLQRRYLAVVWGVPKPKCGIINLPIGRKPGQRIKMAVLRQGGKPAVTHYCVQKRLGAAGGSDTSRAYAASLVECRLETGRTHQIRVHLSHIGHPLIGDKIYGSHFASKARALPEPAQSAIMELDRQALHAAMLGFEHPRTGEALCFQSPLPGDMARLLREFSHDGDHSN